MFNKLNLPAPLLSSLTKMGFNQPTPIQEQAIPLALEGHDIMGTAQTGTGKTGAYSIPIIARLMNDPSAAALILTPTRELAGQVLTVIQQMGDSAHLNTALLIGGDSMRKQMQQLQRRPRIIVGTPGRINDHLTRRSLNLQNVRMMVLDETDRMLDMGFSVQIEQILKYMPAERQTLMFSATLPRQILKISERYMNNPKRVSVGSTTAPAQDVTQSIIRTTEGAKYDDLVAQLNSRKGSILVFVKTKFGAEKLAKKLSRANHHSDAIHGDLQQRQRDRVIAEFRAKEFRILVATDVASRGLDIPHIEHVINYDLPQCPEDYIHRIGRTARAGEKGEAVSLIAPSDGKKWNAILQMLNPGAAREKGAHQGSGEGRRHRGSSHGGGGNANGNSRRRRSGGGQGQHRKGGEYSGERNREASSERPREGGYGERNREGNSQQRPRESYGERSSRPTYGAPRRESGYGDRNREGGSGERNREGAAQQPSRSSEFKHKRRDNQRQNGSQGTQGSNNRYSRHAA